MALFFRGSNLVDELKEKVGLVDRGRWRSCREEERSNEVMDGCFVVGKGMGG